MMSSPSQEGAVLLNLSTFSNNLSLINVEDLEPAVTRLKALLAGERNQTAAALGVVITLLVCTTAVQWVIDLAMVLGFVIGVLLGAPLDHVVGFYQDDSTAGATREGAGAESATGATPSLHQRYFARILSKYLGHQ